MFFKKHFSSYFKYLLPGVLVYFPLFMHLDMLPFRLWDETRLALNAYEMSKGGNWLVTTFLGEPDMWNTKPPLLIWIQSCFINLIGPNELAVRLPSAIAALLTCISLLWFSEKYLKNFCFGFSAVLVLITSAGYVSLHGTRTGDYDALLTLFTTLHCLFLFLFSEKSEYKYLYLSFLALLFAVLTKGVSGLLFSPAILIFLLLKKQVLPLLRNKHFYINVGIFICIILGYYLLREFNNPGYIKAVFNNELGGRFLDTIEGHHGAFLYYHDGFNDKQLPYWYWLLPFGALIGFFHRDKKIASLTVFASICLVTYFLIISSAQTKLRWYDLPLYPFIALLISNLVFWVFSILDESNRIKKKLRINALPYIFIFLFFYPPYTRAIDNSYLPKEKDWEKAAYDVFYFLKRVNANDHTKELKDFYIVHNNVDKIDKTRQQYVYLYAQILEDQGKLKGLKHVDDLIKDDQIIIHHNKHKAFIDSVYNVEVLFDQKTFHFYKINGRK